MTRKEAFINYVNELMRTNPIEMNEDVQFYWDYLNNSDNKETAESPLFTDNGKMILQFLQEHTERETWKSKDIAETLGVSSRTISGAIRKLVKDEFVEKLNDNPVIYAITTKGKEIKID